MRVGREALVEIASRTVLSDYHRAVAGTGLLAVSIAVLLGTVAIVLWRVRNPAWVRDARLAQNASPVSSLLMLAFGAVVTTLVLVLGVFWVTTGHGVVGWAMVGLAATGLSHVWVGVWIRRQPLPQPRATRTRRDP